MYQFTIELTEEDYINFNMTHYFNAPMNKKNKFIMQYITPLFMALLAPLFAMFLYKSSNVNPVIIYAAFGTGILLYLIRFKKFIRKTIKKNIDKMKKTGKLPFDVSSTLVFGPDVITSASPKSESMVYYSALERIDQDEHAFYVYYSTMQAFIVPFKVFASQEEQAQFKAFIQSKIDPNLQNKVQ